MAKCMINLDNALMRRVFSKEELQLVLADLETLNINKNEIYF
jgi:hypothetical protein